MMVSSSSWAEISDSRLETNMASIDPLASVVSALEAGELSCSKATEAPASKSVVSKDTDGGGDGVGGGGGGGGGADDDDSAHAEDRNADEAVGFVSSSPLLKGTTLTVLKLAPNSETALSVDSAASLAIGSPKLSGDSIDCRTSR